jgi:hypothetical protein
MMPSSQTCPGAHASAHLRHCAQTLRPGFWTAHENFRWGLLPSARARAKAGAGPPTSYKDATPQRLGGFTTNRWSAVGQMNITDRYSESRYQCFQSRTERKQDLPPWQKQSSRPLSLCSTCRWASLILPPSHRSSSAFRPAQPEQPPPPSNY